MFLRQLQINLSCFWKYKITLNYLYIYQICGRKTHFWTLNMFSIFNIPTNLLPKSPIFSILASHLESQLPHYELRSYWGWSCRTCFFSCPRSSFLKEMVSLVSKLRSCPCQACRWYNLGDVQQATSFCGDEAWCSYRLCQTIWTKSRARIELYRFEELLSSQLLRCPKLPVFQTAQHPLWTHTWTDSPSSHTGCPNNNCAVALL